MRNTIKEAGSEKSSASCQEHEPHVVDEKHHKTHEKGELDKFESVDRKKAEKEAVWKLDLTVIPIMSLFYLLCFLDRSNLGNARVAGLQTGLGLSDHQYSIALTVTYIPYMAAEIPSNLILKMIGPHIFLPSIVVVWGIITTLQGFVSSYGGLIAARFFLGLVEGGMFPGIVLYLSYFYTRRELQLRIALFFSAASLSGAFSGLLAYGLIRLDGVGGRPGWAWIFIVEGLFTVACGFLGFYAVSPTPDSSRILSAEQKSLISERLARDHRSIPGSTDESDERFKWSELSACFMSPHVILNVICMFFAGTSLYSLAYFQPTIVKSLGYTSEQTQLLSVPPFAVAFVVMLSTAYVSDRYSARGLTACGCAVVALTGFIIFLCADESEINLKYGSLFLSVPGTYSITPPLIAWQSNNSHPHYRKAVAIAIGAISLNAGGILSTWLFPKSESPTYRTAITINMTFCCGVVVFALLNLVWLNFANRRKKTKGQKTVEDLQKSDDEVVDPLLSKMGDRHPDFKYAY